MADPETQTELSTVRASSGTRRVTAAVDPVTTEVIRHALVSAAEQMKRALVRTAFCPVIYEVLDFACSIFDRDVRLLSQAIGLPHFMGRLSFAVEGAIAGIGGREALIDGDILLYNVPYGTGAHPQDAGVVMPVFHNNDLIGFTAILAHWLDIGGKEPYSTDTVDVHQEGTIFPGVKLYNAGELVTDVHRILTANSRVPHLVAGDVDAEIVGVRTGAAAFKRLADRYGIDTLEACIETMFDQSEARVRSYFERIPDGRYVGHVEMDSNGIDDNTIPFDVVVEVQGSSVRLDFSDAPDAQEGPVNTPLPSTVSCSRVAIMTLAGGGDEPNEGSFRPIEIVTRPGSMFHPHYPSPCFLYAWPLFQAAEAIHRAVADAMAGAVPACSGGDILSLVWWGSHPDTGTPWADGSPHPIGQGAHAHGDGANALMHFTQSATRFSPIEVWESRNPWIVERVELRPDSGGAGEFRGGLGVEMSFRALADMWVTAAIERTKNPPWGLDGGHAGLPNSASLFTRDGTTPVSKATRLRVADGSVLELRSGGGGGYGDPAKRDPAAVHQDIAEGYITESRARNDYPHAFED